ncbi:hypothetical protein evm_007493 [Chilo suppressalis]|nr:hypothetical protein evm_007493 [Chilo suppressalis]
MKIALRIMMICILCIMKESLCLKFIDVFKTDTRSSFESEEDSDSSQEENNYPPLKSTTETNVLRRNLLEKSNIRREGYRDQDRDADIKVKIATLVEQTVHDTNRRIKSIDHIKNKYRDDAPYKAGFILSMIKKARDVLNELFNVAIHHKNEWRTLEQLKVFELIVHTNVDTTNLVRQLVEIHIQNLNSTSTSPGRSETGVGRKRVVLLK